MTYGRKFTALMGAFVIALLAGEPSHSQDQDCVQHETCTIIPNNNSIPERISAHGECRLISNRTGASIMVPHGSTNEWVSGGVSFLQRTPTGVNVLACEATTTVIIQDCQAQGFCGVGWAPYGSLANSCSGSRGTLFMNCETVVEDTLSPRETTRENFEVRTNTTGSTITRINVVVPKTSSQSNAQACSAVFQEFDGSGNNTSSTALCWNNVNLPASVDEIQRQQRRLAISYCNRTGNQSVRFWDGHFNFGPSSSIGMSRAFIHNCQ